ncbi:mariner Mos1 transposase [Trichonephila clavipes]|nr:mariner Mos1 transposase [Trichonephila clavipes]
MLISFFDSKGLIYKEFLPERTTLNAVSNAKILKRLMQRIHRVRPEYAKQGSWTLLHDNARPHNTPWFSRLGCTANPGHEWSCDT